MKDVTRDALALLAAVRERDAEAFTVLLDNLSCPYCLILTLADTFLWFGIESGWDMAAWLAECQEIVRGRDAGTEPWPEPGD